MAYVFGVFWVLYEPQLRAVRLCQEPPARFCPKGVRIEAWEFRGVAAVQFQAETNIMHS